MNEPLYVQPDGVRTFSQIHDQVVAALSQVMGSAAPEALGVEATHGAIASAVSTALGQVLGSRQGTMQVTSTSGQTISELLQKAAQMYEQGDQKAENVIGAKNGGGDQKENQQLDPQGQTGKGVQEVG